MKRDSILGGMHLGGRHGLGVIGVIGVMGLLACCKPKPDSAEKLPTPPPGTSSPASSIGSPAPNAASGSITLTKEELAAATQVDGGAQIKETLAAGASKVFRFQHDPSHSILAVNSNKLDKPGDPFTEGKPGYALFDANLRLVGPPRVAWNDAPAVAKPAGVFYVKVVGPGEIDISLQ